MRTLYTTLAHGIGLGIVVMGYLWVHYGDGGTPALATMLLGVFLWVELKSR